MNKVLSCGLEDHVSTAERMKANIRTLQKNTKSTLKEVAQFEAKEKVQSVKDTGYIYHFREGADMDYIFSFINIVKESDVKVPVFVAAGTVKEGGQFLLRASGEAFEHLSKSVLELLEAKGGGKKEQMQGKAKHFKSTIC